MEPMHLQQTTTSRERTIRNVVIAMVIILATLGLGRYVLHGYGYPAHHSHDVLNNDD